jgi:hypothetical protein
MSLSKPRRRRRLPLRAESIISTSIARGFPVVVEIAA